MNLFHIESVKEAARVSLAVRVFPEVVTLLVYSICVEADLTGRGSNIELAGPIKL